VNNDGSLSEVVALNGTVAIVFRGSSYNIPMSIYLQRDYPTTPPLCFVRPTSSMVVKPGHPVVDSNGQCRTPLLARWTAHVRSAAPTGLLLSLVAALAESFGADPPLYSVQSQPQRDMLLSSDIALRYPPPPHSPPPTLAAARLATSAPLPGMATVSRASELRERVKRKAVTALEVIYGEVEQLVVYQAQLEGRARALAAHKQALAMATARYTECAAAFDREAAELDAALQADQEQEQLGQRPHVDEILVPSDPASAQCLAAIVEIPALEDTMFVLSRGITSETVE
jgi:ESCRT-I complex subunit TSG101